MTAEEMATLDFPEQGLLACLRLTGGDFGKTFSAEDILVEAWKMDHATWGLRGHEQEHPVFKAWLGDPVKPKYFREAGHFWGIAPGTPARTVRDRILGVDRVLARA